MGKQKTASKIVDKAMKAKGLQKLRWYCQACQKQCRDENGFKNHINSQSHQRQMMVVSENASKYIEEYSKQFEQNFLDLLSRRFGERRIKANYVYNEYIKDRHHIHMNATQWTTLGEFVANLGREGKCIVEETDKGWYVQWVDRTPETLARKGRLAAMKEGEQSQHASHLAFLRKQAAKARKAAEESGVAVEPEGPTELRRAGDEKMAFSLGGNGAEASASAPAAPTAAAAAAPAPVAAAFARGEGDDDAAATDASRLEHLRREASRAKRPSALEEIMQEEEARKRRRVGATAAQPAAAAAAAAAREGEGKEGGCGGERRDEPWVTRGLVVKVMNKRVGEGALYKKKGVVRGLQGDYLAEVKVLEAKVRVRIDQGDLETVIPKPGGRVRFVRGSRRGEEGTLRALHVDRFCADVELKGGQVVAGVEYEDICKVQDKGR